MKSHAQAFNPLTQAIGELWQTVKRMRRLGLGGPVDHALIAGAGALWETVKTAVKKILPLVFIALTNDEIKYYISRDSGED